MEEVKRGKKEVKKLDKSLDLYLTIINSLEKGIYPSKIAKNLDITKQNLNYYISILKKKKLINKIGYGVWIVAPSAKEEVKKDLKLSTKVASLPVEEINSIRIAMKGKEKNQHKFTLWQYQLSWCTYNCTTTQRQNSS